LLSGRGDPVGNGSGNQGDEDNPPDSRFDRRSRSYNEHPKPRQDSRPNPDSDRLAFLLGLRFFLPSHSANRLHVLKDLFRRGARFLFLSGKGFFYFLLQIVPAHMILAIENAAARITKPLGFGPACLTLTHFLIPSLCLTGYGGILQLRKPPVEIQSSIIMKNYIILSEGAYSDYSPKYYVGDAKITQDELDTKARAIGDEIVLDFQKLPIVDGIRRKADGEEYAYSSDMASKFFDCMEKWFFSLGFEKIPSNLPEINVAYSEIPTNLKHLEI
jgi:hypothetical protein